MIADHWPLYDLRLRTPRLELRLPTPDDLGALAALAADGVHDPGVQPFLVAWTDEDPAVRARSVLQWHWRQLSRWSADDWSLQFAVLADRVPIGTQEVAGARFATLREVSSGSWLGRAHQRRGYGTEMRAAVLHLAFQCLGAEYATTEAFDDNHASYGVSRKLGYLDDGVARHVVRGRAVLGRRLRLDRAGWDAARAVPVTVEGLESCRTMFGL